jgi:release factor glutamine methyltransferase
MPETVAGALAAARALGIERLDAQLLLAHHLARPRTWLVAHAEAALAEAVAQAFLADVSRRADGVPLAYLTGTHEFHGLKLHVTPDVLDPRPDTETLVDWALDLLANEAAPLVADLGTGSGAIALAIRHACPQATVWATDASEAALIVARGNAQRLGLELHWHHGHWWQGFPAAKLHLAVSNPPYIAAGDPHLRALHHEPLMALTPGGDGLGAIREIVAGAPSHLRPGAWLLLEHGHDQAEAVHDCLALHGFAELSTRNDLAGHVRCSGGRWWPSVVPA